MNLDFQDKGTVLTKSNAIESGIEHLNEANGPLNHFDSMPTSSQTSKFATINKLKALKPLNLNKIE